MKDWLKILVAAVTAGAAAGGIASSAPTDPHPLQDQDVRELRAAITQLTAAVASLQVRVELGSDAGG